MAQWDGYGKYINFQARLKELYSCPIAYWAFDYQADGQEWHERLIKECDVYLSKPFFDARKHKNWNWLPQDFAPSFLDKIPDSEAPDKDIEVLFTGSWVPWESGQERVKVLKAINKKYDLHIYGVTPDQWEKEGFQNVHGPVMDHELPELIARAKINFSMDHVLAPGYWSDRNAQIMACGGFVLFRSVAPSWLTFDEGIEYFKTTEECLDKIDRYLKDDPSRKRIADEGYKLAQDTLMVTNRVQELLTILDKYL